MKAYIGITDGDWFSFLAARKPDEVNFWQPSGSRAFRRLAPGELFLFKLHSPQNFIVGGGLFAHFSILPVSLAWDAFLEKNGAVSIEEMRQRIGKYRRIAGNTAEDYRTSSSSSPSFSTRPTGSLHRVTGNGPPYKA